MTADRANDRDVLSDNGMHKPHGNTVHRGAGHGVDTLACTAQERNAPTRGDHVKRSSCCPSQTTNGRLLSIPILYQTTPDQSFYAKFLNKPAGWDSCEKTIQISLKSCLGQMTTTQRLESAPIRSTVGYRVRRYSATAITLAYESDRLPWSTP